MGNKYCLAVSGCSLGQLVASLVQQAALRANNNHMVTENTLDELYDIHQEYMPGRPNNKLVFYFPQVSYVDPDEDCKY